MSMEQGRLRRDNAPQFQNLAVGAAGGKVSAGIGRAAGQGEAAIGGQGDRIDTVRMTGKGTKRFASRHIPQF